MRFATSDLFQRSDPVGRKTKISAVMPQRVRSSGFATEMRPDTVRPAHNDCDLLLESSIGAFLDLAAPARHALICPSPQILPPRPDFTFPVSTSTPFLSSRTTCCWVGQLSIGGGDGSITLRCLRGRCSCRSRNKRITKKPPVWLPNLKLYSLAILRALSACLTIQPRDRDRLSTWKAPARRRPRLSPRTSDLI